MKMWTVEMVVQRIEDGGRRRREIDWRVGYVVLAKTAAEAEQKAIQEDTHGMQEFAGRIKSVKVIEEDEGIIHWFSRRDR
jgi:hypothetical protein